MTSNYPPGVSGFEYQIAGPLSEVDDTREVPECERFESLVMRTVTRYGTYPLGAIRTTTKSARRFRRVLGKVCTFEGGEVAGILEDHVWFEWECPSCGSTNSTEQEAPEPPEQDRDDWY